MINHHAKSFSSIRRPFGWPDKKIYTILISKLNEFWRESAILFNYALFP